MTPTVRRRIRTVCQSCDFEAGNSKNVVLFDGRLMFVRSCPVSVRLAGIFTQQADNLLDMSKKQFGKHGISFGIINAPSCPQVKVKSCVWHLRREDYEMYTILDLLNKVMPGEQQETRDWNRTNKELGRCNICVCACNIYIYIYIYIYIQKNK